MSSKRPLLAWESLIVYGGDTIWRPTGYRPFGTRSSSAGATGSLGAMVGMKPPQFAVWMFTQLGARAGDDRVYLYAPWLR